MNTEDLPFKLMPELFKGKHIAIKLNFKSPSLISSKSDLDTLEVIVKESVSVTIDKNTIILPQNLKDASPIPSQLTQKL
jgi:hypothetical protein